MSDAVILLQMARRLREQSESNASAGAERVPVRRSVLLDAAEKLQWAYTAIDTAPTPEEEAQAVIDNLRAVVEWFYELVRFDTDVPGTMPVELAQHARWLWDDSID
jgi:hypothetical protein